MNVEKAKGRFFYLLQILGTLGLTGAIVDYFVNPTEVHFLVVRFFGLFATIGSILLYRKDFKTLSILTYIIVGLILFSIDNFGFEESYLFFFSAAINTINALVFFKAKQWILKAGTGLIIWAYSIALYIVHFNYVKEFPEAVIASPEIKLIIQFSFLGAISLIGITFEAYTVHLENLKRIEKEDALEKTLILMKSIVHDIKQPLSQIPLLNGIIATKLPEAFKSESNYLEQSTQTVMRTMRLIHESQRSIENLSFITDEKSADLEESVERILPLYKSTLDALTDFNLSITAKGFIPMQQTDLLIVLRNLLSNSIKYRHKGAPLKIDCRWDASQQEFRWSDTGIGVEKSVLKQLGKTPIRADHRIQGSGQGLLNVASIADQNNFMMYFEPNEPCGLCVTLKRGSAITDSISDILKH